MATDQNELYGEVQKRLVASLLYDSEGAVQALERITEDDFVEPSLAIIFKAAAELLRDGETVSTIAIAEKLEKEGLLEQSGGVAQLYSLRNEGKEYLTEAPITLYSRILLEASEKNHLQGMMKEFGQVFESDSGTFAVDGVGKLQSELNDVLYRLSDTTATSSNVDLADDFEALLDERREIAEQNRENAGGLQGIPTSLKSLNEYTTGWLPGQLVTICAQTGVGKSIFAINSMVAAGQAGKSVMFFSLEMGRHEVENRIVSSITGVPLNSLKQGEVTDEERERIREGLEKVREMKFVVDTEAELTIDMIRARAMKQAQSPEGLDMILIDYLQLLTPTSRESNREQQVATISRNVKLLAKSLEVPVVIVAQLVRPKKDQEDLTPTKYDIRESGAIANDSDVVLILHRPETEDGSTPHTRVILDKNRDGVAGKTILCHSDLACSAFREIVKSENARMTDEDLEALDAEFDGDNSTGDPDDLDFDGLDDEADF